MPRNHPAHVAQARTEAVAIPEAIRAGVRTPSLIAFDDSLELLPVPYLIVDHVEARDAEVDFILSRAVWTEVGHDLALLHTKGNPSSLPPRPIEPPDIYSLIDDRATDGTITAHEAGWLTRWVDALGEQAAPRLGFVHGDLQMSNVLVRDDTYVALIDFGCAGDGELIGDFRPQPMAALEHVLDGYREVDDLPDGVEADIVRARLLVALWLLPRRPDPRVTWAERPLAWLVDLMRFFVDPPEEWKAAAPPGRYTP